MTSVTLTDGTARTLRAMITGIGFVGGDAVLKHAIGVKGVIGVATAASVWTTGAMAASVAHGYYTIAVSLSLTSVLVIKISERLARRGGALRDVQDDELELNSRP